VKDELVEIGVVKRQAKLASDLNLRARLEQAQANPSFGAGRSDDLGIDDRRRRCG